jgi:pyruvate dehydrogenase E1 component alpha subunit
MAYGMKYKRSEQVSCVFHGDAAVETGVFYESMNFAVVKKLPVLFVCENNLYSVYSPLAVRQPEGRSIASMVAGMGAQVDTGDGNDVEEVYAKSCEAITAIRTGGGPRFLEFSTYRWLEHCGPSYDNHIGYRSEAEFLDWKSREPIARFESLLLTKGKLTVSDIHQMDADIANEVKLAFDFAEESPMPSAEDAFSDLYFEAPHVNATLIDMVG